MKALPADKFQNPRLRAQLFQIMTVTWLLSWIFYIYSSIFLSYLQVPISNVALFIAEDGWCRIQNGDGLGVHCWGDFALPYYGTPLPADPLRAPDVVLHNTPATLLILSSMRPLGFDLAITVWLFGLLLLAFAPSIFMSRQFERSHRLFIITASGFTSLPVLLTLDRGNHAASVIGLFLIVGLLLWKNQDDITRDSWFLRIAVIVLGSLAFSLKFWGPLVILIPIIFKRPYLALGTLFGGLSVTFASILALTDKPFQYIPRWLEAILSSENASLLGPHSVSISGLFSRLACVVQSTNFKCNFTDYYEHADSQFLIRTGVTVMSLIALALLANLSAKANYFLVTFGFVILIPVVSLPDAGAYNSIAFTAFLALVLAEFFRKPLQGTRPIELKAITVLCLIPTLVVPLGWFRQNTFELFSFLDMWRFQNVVTPVATILLIYIMFRVLIRHVNTVGQLRNP